MSAPLRIALITACLIPVAVATLVLAPAATGYPEPSVASDAWQLELEWQKPRPIAIHNDHGLYEWYWYMPYKVVNNSDQTVLFIPEVTIATDTGQILTAGQNIPTTLFPRIEQRLNNPLVESPIEVVGPLLQGVDYAKESVVIWPAFDENVDEMTLFFAGLSAETATVENPVTGETVMMRRTRMLRFKLPGDPRTPQSQTMILEEERDVMR